MKFYTSYYYQIRNFPPNLIALSTAIWPPKYLNFGIPDKRGVICINCLPLQPGISCEGLCDGSCDPKHPKDCSFLKVYREQLDKIDFNNFIKSLDKIAKHYHQLSMEEIDALLKKASLFATTREALKSIREVKDNVEEYKDGRTGEHMESRVRVPKGKFITLDLIDKIMLPDYLKDNKEVLSDVQKLRSKGFNNIVYYHCKWPKDYDEQDKRRREEIEKHKKEIIKS